MPHDQISIFSWPRAILHIDADAFFASCEQAVNPALKGKPVATGRERGIVAAASYEAKAMGIKRAIGLFEAKKICPDLICLPSNYETYSLFSVRIFDIIRRFSPDVEEYSIDEAFVDITGLRRTFHTSYGDIARQIQETVEKELDITVSVGVSISKVLAKVASKWNKPKGLTVIPGKHIHQYLSKLPVRGVWGIGANTAALLNKLGVRTALDYAKKDEAFIKRHLSKPYYEVWQELNGHSVYPVVTETKSSYQSIGKSKTFTPPSGDSSFVFAQLSKNLENACIRARRHRLIASKVVLLLKGQDFIHHGMEIKLSRGTAYPVDILGPLKEGFDKIFRQGRLYRSTGIILSGLRAERSLQFTLFEDSVRIDKMCRVYDVVDALSKRYGKHTLIHGSSMATKLQAQHEGERGDVPSRKLVKFKGENKRQRLGMPFLDIKV